MKYNIFAILLLSIIFSSSSYADDKGRISLTFNDAKIDLPVNSVVLRKENFIVLTARAELNNENIKQLISMEMSFNSLSKDSVDVYDSFLIEVRNQGSAISSREVMIIRFEDNGDDGEVSYTKGSKSWNANAISLRFDVSKIDFLNDHLMIQGTFNVKIRSTESETPLIPVAEIKDRPDADSGDGRIWGRCRPTQQTHLFGVRQRFESDGSR